ncbi:hypothetical protein K1719_000196 [Acacia pycnantha]|nr:hypothetical protein K1719_000196 [Acacia pycnantha]
MGRATRWLKGLFGMKKDRDKKQNSNSDHRGNLNSAAARSAAPPPNHLSPAEAAWLQSFYGETEDQQNKHAIEVAAATAAAADAAVAAAQAAAAVVRLTNHSRTTTIFGRGHEKLAAVKIQTVFRGFLARKALRALKGLVKIQALVRGFLVRKQATATLHSMQALIRAQATVRSHKARQVMNKNEESYKFETQPRRSTERFEESRRLSSSFDASMNNNTNSTDGSPTPKIVEVDTGGCRPKSRSRRSNTSMSDFGDDPLFQAMSSPLPVPQIRTPARISTAADRRVLPESEWGLTGEEYKFSTAQSTPRFTNSCSCGSLAATPKSVYAERLVWQYGNYPNYMANTQSSKAKLRSRSAPKQRPESSGGGAKKRLSLNEVMESRSSLSGIRMQRTCSKVQEAINFKNAVMGKIEKSGEIERDSYYLQRRWYGE